MDQVIKKPAVTILMPVYNGEKYLKEAIDSILCQTFTDFIFLIIDDGSTDNSFNIIKSYKDERIKLLINEKNLGLSKTLNIGIESSDSKYIARMDHDDISAPSRIEEQVKFMEAHPEIGMCGTWMMSFGAKSRTYLKKFPTKNVDIKAMLLFHNPIAHPTVMIKKNILEKHNLRYDDGLEDYDLWERMSMFTDMANIPKVLHYYRLHQDQLSRTYQAKQEKLNKIQKRQYERLGIEKGDLSSILAANKKYHLYNNWSLRKIIYKIYYANFKSFIKKLIK